MKNENKTIYVISSHDYDGGFLTIGAWRKRGYALDEATDYIVSRMHWRKDIGRAFSNDMNHPDMVGAVDYDDDKLVFIKTEKDVRSYIRDVLGGDGCYMIEDLGNFNITFRFDIYECHIED